MYSTHNEGKYVVAKRFHRTLTTKIYKHMPAVSKNVYFDVLNNIVRKTIIHVVTLLKSSLMKLNLILMLNTVF